MKEYFLYKYNKKNTSLYNDIVLSNDFKVVVWSPSFFKMPIKGIERMPIIVWLLFHYFFIFKNKKLKLIYITNNGDMVSRLLVTPGYFRFPFMKKTDLQLGDVWTDHRFRGKGLASYLISFSMNLVDDNRVSVFYVVDCKNKDSIRLAEKNGFELQAAGNKIRFMYSTLFGYYNFK